MYIYVIISLISLFSSFLAFNQDFIITLVFPVFPATDDVIN